MKDRSKLLDLIDGYEIPEEHLNSRGDPVTGKTFFARSFSGKVGGSTVVLPRLFGFIKRAIRMLVYTSTRAYGTALLFFGAFSTVARLVLDYFGIKDAWSYSALAVGLVMTMIGVLFMFVDKPLGIALENFSLTDYVLFEFFCIKKIQKSAAVPKGYPTPAAIALGVLLAVLGTLFHPTYVLLVIGVVLFTLLSLASPEFSFLFSILALPFLDFFDGSVAIFTFLLVITVISFVRKVASGKRVYVLEQYDILIGLVLVFVLTSGIFLKGIESFESSVMLLLGAVGYVIAGNLVTNRRLADRFTVAVSISALPAATYVIAKFLFGAVRGDYTYSAGGFYSSSTIGLFLLVSGFFILSCLIESKSVGARIFYSALLAVTAVALGLILNFVAYITVAFAIAAYFILKARRGAPILLVLLCAIPYIPFLLPVALTDGAIATALLGRPMSEHLEILRMAGRVFLEHPFLGIGMGSESFSAEMARFGISADSCGNLFLELACEAGVFALIFFVLVLIVSMRHRSRYRHYVKHSEVRTASKTAAVVTASMIVYSTVFYIWDTVAVCYIFWTVLGFGSASLRIAKREYDDRKIYYNDVVSPESSDVDVQLDGFSTKK